jgi:twitching motility protein PilT
MIELFPAAKQPLVRQILSTVLRGVISQRLLPQVDGGRIAAVEVMVNTARVAEMIRDEAKTDEIPKAIHDGIAYQMQTFQQHLVELALDGIVDEETAANAASNRHDFELALGRAKRAKEALEAAGDNPDDEVGQLLRATGATQLRRAS